MITDELYGDEAERAMLTNLRSLLEERLLRVRLRIAEIDKKLEKVE